MKEEKEKIPEVFLDLEVKVVEVKERELKKDFDYHANMYEKDIKIKLEELKSELKFHGFEMSEVYLDELFEMKFVDFQDLKKDKTISMYLFNFIDLEIDEMVDILKNFDEDSLFEAAIEELPEG